MIAHRRSVTDAPDGERGASLIFALVFIMVIFTILTGAVGYATTAERSTSTYRRDRALHYAADAALEVGVQMVKAKPTLGTTLTGCNMVLPLDDHDPYDVFAAGAFLNVSCLPTPNNPTPPPSPPAGQQSYRDVTFQVICRLPAGFNVQTGGPMPCGTAGQTLNLGAARVRYDIDPGVTPATAWAIVPKIISWEIAR